MSPRIERLQIENWRGIERFDEALPAAGPTWLVGRNGSGKSSLLDGLAFLADAVRAGTEARRARLRGRAGEPGYLDFRELLHDADRPARWVVDLRAGDAGWRYELVLGAVGDGFTVLRERVERLSAGVASPVLEAEGGAARWIRGDTALGGGRWEPVEPPLGAPLLGRVPVDAPAARGVRDLIAGVWLLRLDPLLMRGSTAVWSPGQPLERHGRDLQSWAAQVIAADPGLVDLLPRISGALGWDGLGLGLHAGRAELWFDEGEGRRRPWAFASDGEATHLAMALLAVLTPDDLHVLLLDEPAVSLDRDAARELAGWVAELADVVQVLAATQSLDAVDVGARSEALLFRRQPGRPALVSWLDRDDRARAVSGLYRAGEAAHLVWDPSGTDGDG